MRNGGDPELAGGEFDNFAGGVFEDDLAVLRRFTPSSLDNFAVLEDVGAARADGGDAFVITVSHGVLLDHHSNDGAGSDLFEIAALGFGIGLVETGRAFIDEVSVAALIATSVGVGLGIIVVNCVVVDPVTEVDANSANEWSNVADGIFGAVGVGNFVGDCGGFGGREAGESFGARGGIAMVGVKLEEVGRGGEEIVPEATGVVLAPHIGIIFVEVALSALADGGEGLVGAASVSNGTIERSIPVKIIGAERTDGADGARSRILENRGEASNASLSDCLKNYASLSEPDLWTAAVGAAVWDLDTESWARIEAVVGDFETSEITINWVGVFNTDVEVFVRFQRRISAEKEKIGKNAT